jgi:hypothetical protein
VGQDITSCAEIRIIRYWWTHHHDLVSSLSIDVHFDFWVFLILLNCQMTVFVHELEGCTFFFLDFTMTGGLFQALPPFLFKFFSMSIFELHESTLKHYFDGLGSYCNLNLATYLAHLGKFAGPIML